jgi:hypothetical protein
MSMSTDAGTGSYTGAGGGGSTAAALATVATTGAGRAGGGAIDSTFTGGAIGRGAATGRDTGAATGATTGRDTAATTGRDTGAATGATTGRDTTATTGRDTGAAMGATTGRDTAATTGRDTGAAFITGGEIVPVGIREVGGATGAAGLPDVASRGDDSRFAAGLFGSGQPNESGRFVLVSTGIAEGEGREGIAGIGRTTPGIGRRAGPAAGADRSLFINIFGTLSVDSSESSDEPRSGDSIRRSQQKTVRRVAMWPAR